MKAYNNIRFTEQPDLADIKSEVRKTSVGRLKRGTPYIYFVDNIITIGENGEYTHGIHKVRHNDRRYCNPKGKIEVRRYLKRRDKALENKFEKLAENLG